MTHDVPVVIAGAGPVGLALALGLARQGVRSLVLEAKPTPDPHSRAPGIMMRTLEIWRGWGVLDRFLEAGYFLQNPGVWVSGESEPRMRIDFSVLAGLTPTPGVLVLPQDRTEALLRDAALETGLVTLRAGCALESFSERPDGIEVTAVSDETVTTVSCAYLVGCDGAHSTVRRQLGWELAGKTYPGRFFLADVRFADARNELPWPRLAPRATGALFALRIEPALWRLIGTADPDAPDQAIIGQEALERNVDELFGPGPFETAWASVFRVHCRNAPHLRSGRILLAGDAGHLNSPAGAQGMNAGIHDAHNLAWKLARVLQGAPADPLLESYDTERRQAIVHYTDRTTDWLTRLLQMPWPRARRTVARMAARALTTPPVLRRVLPRMGMLDVAYRHSPLLAGPGRHVGMRAPGGVLTGPDGRRRHVLDLVWPEAALLLFDDGHLPRWDVAEVSRLVAGVPGLKVLRVVARGAPLGPEDWADIDGEVWRYWGAVGGQAALVRPDGYVGWEATRPPAEALAAGVRRALGIPAPQLRVMTAPEAPSRVEPL